MNGNEPKKKIIGPWQTIHGVIWVVGLYILWTKGWWWPGILILVGISALYEAYLRSNVPEAFTEEKPADKSPTEQGISPQEVTLPPANTPVTPIQEHRIDLLPEVCANCGAPIRGHEVKWSGSQSANCPYCGSNLPMKKA